MKKLLLALTLFLAPSLAWAQCAGVFPANTVCGNTGASPNVPSAVPFSGTIIGPSTSVVGDFATWGNTSGNVLADTPYAALAHGGLGGDQSAATVGQVPVFPGTGGAAVPTTPTCSLISDAGTVCQKNTGASGHTIPFLDGNNTLSGNNIIPTLLADGSNNFVAFDKAGTRSWQWSYDNRNFGSGVAVDALKLCSDLPCALPLWTTNYGFFNIGNLGASYFNLNGAGGLSDTTGPALRVVGDIAAGDIQYFGSSPFAVTGAVNNGSGAIRLTVASTATLTTNDRIQVGGVGGVSAATGIWAATVVDGTHLDLQGSTFSGTYTSGGWYGTGQDPMQLGKRVLGAVPSLTHLSTAEGLNVDGTGGAYMLLTPDVSLKGTGNDQGSVQIFAYGSGGTGAYTNKIRLGSRSGASSLTDIMVLGQGSGGVTIPQIATDATHTDATVCEDTTTHALYNGSGSAGICLGTSGRQFKNLHGPISVGLEQIAALPLYDYTFKRGHGDNGEHVQYGPVAQDVAKVAPELVRRDAKGNIINYDIGGLWMGALRAIQQLKADNDNLRAKVDRLERRYDK